jgi:hypothetical protein
VIILRPRRFALLLLATCALGGADGLAPGGGDEQAVASSLAVMLQAARSVISDKQALIDDPTLGDKGLTGRVVLDLTRHIYQSETGHDPYDTASDSREGILLRTEMDAIVAVLESNQVSINVKGVGFKGFIPAVFGRLVTEAFASRADGRAAIKITAPIELVRNRKSRPDSWESMVIKQQFAAPTWAHGVAFAQTVDSPTGPVFRMAVPEYYTQSCLSCHGQPKASLDITGYPKEGASLGDLGAVISILLRN